MRNKSIFVFVIALLMFPAFTAAQTTDDLFNGNVLHEVRLAINPNDYAELKKDFEGNTYFDSDFHWIYGGKDYYYPQVAIRSRGVGSRSSIKPSFKIEFNRFESRNTLMGLENIVLRADTQDSSMMHERVAMEFFRKMGIPAPRESHAKLFINGQYAGLYTIVEEVDDTFLMRNFGQNGGYLYSYEWANTFVFEDRGSDPATYSPVPFKPQNHFDKLDPNPLAAMVQIVNSAPLAQFQTSVSQYIDLNNFLREIAAENFLSEQDGVIGNYGLNNFFLYRLEGKTQSVFIPWDKSNAFWSLDWPIMHNIFTDVLTVRAAGVPSLINQYRDYLRQAADIAGGPGGWLEQEITKEYLQVRQAALDDTLKQCDPGASGTLKPCSNAQFEAEVQFMINFARQRAADVRLQLDGSASQEQSAGVLAEFFHRLGEFFGLR